MDAGQRNHPVYFEYPDTTNTRGSVAESWNDASGNSPPTPDWAKIISQKGTEAFEAGRRQSRRILRIAVPYRADVLTTWRFKWMDEYYNIIEVDRSHIYENELWITGELVGA